MDFDLHELNRRGAIVLAAALGTGLSAVGKAGLTVLASAAEKPEAKGGEEVSATEDLMREHGVLRRTLIVYAELADRLRYSRAATDVRPLADAARLFREFGEDYHEHTLEEVYIFPEVQKAGGPNAKLVEVLSAQHQRGREITDYISRVASIGIRGDALALADALTSFTRMYNAHSAWEDTVLFPAWKAKQSKARLDELAGKFEDIEHEKFGKDGFENAVERISRIEQMVGISDLGFFTAPRPPAF